MRTAGQENFVTLIRLDATYSRKCEIVASQDQEDICSKGKRMTTCETLEDSPDFQLWQLVLEGNARAFEVLVRRHQSLVCAVAYNACGDLARSEDVAQETFWAAWRERESLKAPSRLLPWLCGIARNLGKNAARRAARPIESAVSLDAVTEPRAKDLEPTEEAVSREEETLIWETLEQIPESYREPMILFYREGQSTAKVATALGLSEDAVKQRLSRGRAMLRERVIVLIEGGLRRSRPGRAFTVAVMTGLAASSAGATTATAAGVGGLAAKAAVGAGIGGGVLGGVLGSLVGLGGGWLGTWIPAQLAPTRSERDHILKSGRRILVVSFGLIALLLTLGRLFAGRLEFLIALGVGFLVFQAYIAFECLRLVRVTRRIRAEARPDAVPNETALRQGLDVMAARYRGRVFRSRASFLGLPLINVNVSDPPTREPNGSDHPMAAPRIARGWIAVGDQAQGVLLAIGGTAYGLIAIGGRAGGGLSFGGIAVGLVSVGGASLGLIGIGGLGIGISAIGGLAVGWQACGGGAIAWDVACGGGAAALRGAVGGAAFARDYALGPQGWATHFNDDAAKAVLLGHPLKRGMDWYIANTSWITPSIVVLSMLSILIYPLMYRRDRRP